MRKAKWTITLTLALVFAMSAAAMAQVIVRTPQIPLSPTAIPQFKQLLPRLSLDNAKGIKVTLAQDLATGSGVPVDVSMCEFQTNILPANSLGKKNPAAPMTWVWGYNNGYASPDGCVPAATPTPPASYIGPVVLNKRGLPTRMTYKNRLPDADGSQVKAYTYSTDQTLQWADPFSLLALGAYPPPEFFNPFPGIPVPPDYVTYPEMNTCNEEAKKLPFGGIMPAPCLDNYGYYMLNAVRTSYQSPIPAAPHLHGGEIPAFLDGGPDAWWTPNGIYGHGYYSLNGPDDAVLGNAIYTYPNVQEAAPIWFHDHVLGATRLNVYAGIAGGYMVTDDILGDPAAPTLPAGLLPLGLDRNGNGTLDLDNSPTGISDEVLIPVVIQDRMFDTQGQLLFPTAMLNPEHPFWIPEFVGDVIVVNGKAWPTTSVEPKRYRFLFLNGSNARTYELFLLDRATGLKGPVMWVIGNDQGYLAAPELIDPNGLKPNDKLVIMPGERYEVVIDFGAFLGTGATLELRNTAKTPYPAGAPVVGNTTGRIMQIVVSATCPSGQCGLDAGGNQLDSSYDPSKLTAIRTINRLADPLTGTPAVIDPTTVPPTTIAVNKVRQLTLNEVIGPGGPVEILMNNTTYTGIESQSKRSAKGLNDFFDVPSEWNVSWYSEQPQEGETELWEIVNVTADAHPIHPHLVAFQILNRQPFNFKAYDAAYNLAFPGGGLDPVTNQPYPPGVYIPGFGPPCNYNTGGGKCAPAAPPAGYVPPLGGNPDVNFFLAGAALPPNLQERGWKDTAISYPGEVLRLLIRFAPTTLANTTPAADAFYEFSPAEGHGYVWHCHIIDHEDNEMMRPFNVSENLNPTIHRTFVKQDPSNSGIVGY